MNHWPKNPAAHPTLFPENKVFEARLILPWRERSPKDRALSTAALALVALCAIYLVLVLTGPLNWQAAPSAKEASELPPYALIQWDNISGVVAVLISSLLAWLQWQRERGKIRLSKNLLRDERLGRTPLQFPARQIAELRLQLRMPGPQSERSLLSGRGLFALKPWWWRKGGWLPTRNRLEVVLQGSDPARPYVYRFWLNHRQHSRKLARVLQYWQQQHGVPYPVALDAPTEDTLRQLFRSL